MYDILEKRDLVFATVEGVSLALDLFFPKTEKAVPLLIFFHGGGLESGDKTDYMPNVQELVREGIAVATPNYRMYPQVSHPAFLADAASAVSWLKAHVNEHFPCNGIFIGGHSAGAYLSMMLCFDTRWLAAEGLDAHAFDGYLFASGQPTTHLNILKYRGEDMRRAMIDETAALFHVTGPKGPPLQILCADNDFPARLEQTQLLVATLKHYAYESEIDFQVLQGHDHGSYLERVPGENRPSLFFERAVPFIRRHTPTR